MSEYKKTKTADGVRFEVIPAKGPLPIGLGIAALFLFFIGLGVHIVFSLFLVASVGYVMFKNYRQSHLYRTPASFTVSKDGVRHDNGFISVEDIHRAIIRNHVNNADVDLVAYNNMHAVSVNNEAKRLNKLAPISYRLDIESGGKATTLAGGLNETTAYGLMTDVGNIVGLQSSS